MTRERPANGDTGDQLIGLSESFARFTRLECEEPALYRRLADGVALEYTSGEHPVSVCIAFKKVKTGSA